MPAVSEASAKARLILRYTISGIPVSSTLWFNKRALLDIPTGRLYFDNGVDTVPLVGYSQLESKVRLLIDKTKACQSGGITSYIGGDVYNNDALTDTYVGRVEYVTVGSAPAAEPTRVATFTFKDVNGGRFRYSIKAFAKSYSVYRTFPAADTAVNDIFTTLKNDDDFVTRYDDEITIAQGVTVTTFDKYEKLFGYRR